MIDIKQLDTSIDGEESTKYMALHEGLPVGFVDLRYRGLKSATFRQLFVREDARLAGIGRSLVELCVSTAEMAGCENIGATVDAKNLSVLPFYQKLGFVVACYYDDGDLMIVKFLTRGE